MTIEIAPKPPAPHKASGGPDPQASKAKAPGGASAEGKANKTAASKEDAAAKAGPNGAGDGDATGFLAILASLGDGAVQGAAAGLTDGQESLSDRTPTGDAPADAAGLSAPGTFAATVPAATSADAVAAARADADPAKAALARSAAGASVNKPAGFGDATQDAGAPEGASRRAQRAAAGHGQGSSHGKADQQALSGNADASAVNPQGASAAKAEQTPALDFKMFAAMQEARGAHSAKTPEPAVPSGLAGTDKRVSDRVEGPKTTADATYSAAPLGVSTNNVSVNTSADAGTTPDVQVAEQVKYWMSQDVQNAELKLDGLGDKPVEVSISLNGNEAHVAFRTDEIQTRDVLENAGLHLKDMLAREGLVLSGVSVGTAGTGAGDGGGNERRARQETRQALVSAAPLSGVDGARRVHTGSGRSLDLFV